MKKITLLLLLIVSINGYSQANFKWEKIDSISKKQSQIYASTKMFIAEYWKSAQNVIQNDDKESGIILVKGICIKACTYMMYLHEFTFSYTVKFFMKDSKYKIEIDNVINTSHICDGHVVWKTVQPIDNYEGNMNLSKRRGNEIFTALKTDLQGIVDNYEIYIKKPTVENSNW